MENTTQTPTAAQSLLATAIEKGADAATVSRLAVLVEAANSRAEQERFAAAFVTFQAECPAIFKARRAKFNTKAGTAVNYQFASLDDVMDAIAPSLARNQISIAFDSSSNNGTLTVTVRVRVGSYYEDRKFAVPIAANLLLSDPQKFGTSLTYAKRYALCAALNLVVSDREDNDAAPDDGHAGPALSPALLPGPYDQHNDDTPPPNVQPTSEPTIGDDQAAELKATATDVRVDWPRFMRFCGVDNLALLPASKLRHVLGVLEAKGKDNERKARGRQDGQDN